MTPDDLNHLRRRLVSLRDDILGRLAIEIGAGELGLMAGVMAAILATEDKLAEVEAEGGAGH